MAKENEKAESPETKNSEEKVVEPEIKVEKVETPNIEVKDTYTKEEVDALLKDASKNGAQQGVKIAKEQLYPEIERQKDKVKELNTKMADLQNQIPTTVEEKQQLEKEKTDLATELTQTKTQLTDAQTKLKAVEDTALDAIDQVKSLSTKLDEKDVNEYRLGKINEAKGKIVAEMVTGSTKEEIDASIEKAKEKYNSIVGEVRQDLNLPTVEKQQEIEEQQKQETEVPEINRLEKTTDFSNWKGSREEIRKKLYRSYGVEV